jgi:predicted Zn-dependent protease
MTHAEKLAQKLSNLKSKSKIKDYFIFFDESRSLEIVTLEGGISKKSHPTHYSELSSGTYFIVWDSRSYSYGEITTSFVNMFDDLIDEIKKNALPLYDSPYIPSKGIYPMIRAYSKALADMIDVPEYLLKLTDILDEMFNMVKCVEGKAEIVARDGNRYAYSSMSMDENYAYTTFDMTIDFGNHLHWKTELAEVFSISQFQEFFSFLADTYNNLILSKAESKKVKSASIILTPMDFQRIFKEQIIDNINGEEILDGTSIFSKEHFFSKAKVLGTFSMSYDPLINSKRGTYRFSKSGVKPEREYFIKFGKLESPITNNVNYSLFSQTKPSISIEHFGNLKFEGIKKQNIQSLLKQNQTIFITKLKKIIQKTHTTHKIIADNALSYNDGKSLRINTNFSIDINLYDKIGQGKAELVEFPDGQLGLMVANVDLHY